MGESVESCLFIRSCAAVAVFFTVKGKQTDRLEYEGVREEQGGY